MYTQVRTPNAMFGQPQRMLIPLCQRPMSGTKSSSGNRMQSYVLVLGASLAAFMRISNVHCVFRLSTCIVLCTHLERKYGNPSQHILRHGRFR